MGVQGASESTLQNVFFFFQMMRNQRERERQRERDTEIIAVCLGFCL